MNNNEGYAKKLKKILTVVLVQFFILTIGGILGSLGIGNKYVNAGVGIILLIIAVVIVTKLFRMVKDEMLYPLLEIKNAMDELTNGNLDVEVSYEGEN